MRIAEVVQQQLPYLLRCCRLEMTVACLETCACIVQLILLLFLILNNDPTKLSLLLHLFLFLFGRTLPHKLLQNFNIVDLNQVPCLQWSLSQHIDWVVGCGSQFEVGPGVQNKLVQLIVGQYLVLNKSYDLEGLNIAKLRIEIACASLRQFIDSAGIGVHELILVGLQFRDLPDQPQHQIDQLCFLLDRHIPQGCKRVHIFNQHDQCLVSDSTISNLLYKVLLGEHCLYSGNLVSCKIYHLLLMDSVLEQAKEMELKYRNKIIELEKQLQFENLRASEYENKFKEAVMANSSSKSDQQLLEKLISKDEEINKLRKQLLEANRKINESSTNEDVEDLIKQNSELRNVVQQLKNAAIAALMEKQNEIQQLKKKADHSDLSIYVQELEAKYHQLESSMNSKVNEYESEIAKINEKLNQQRSGFSDKLTKLQREISHEENQKEKLLEKAQNLEGNLENMEKVVEKYEAKIYELENSHSIERINYEKAGVELQRKIQQLKNDLKLAEKNQQKMQASLIHLNKNIEDLNKKIEALNQQKEQLDRKLKIKNRKNNKNDTNKSILESFQGFSQKADVYASFVRREHRDMTKQSFIGQASKLSDISEIEAGEIDNLNEYIQDYTDITTEASQSQPSFEQSTPKTVTKNQPAVDNNALRAKIQKIQQLENQIQNLLNQIDNYNNQINKINKQLQKERQDKLQLRQKSNKAESQYKVEKESLRLHIFKLENALLVEKLQNAQKMQTNKQIREYEKKLYEEQIQKLKQQIETPKKKKGLFK